MQGFQRRVVTIVVSYVLSPQQEEQVGVPHSQSLYFVYCVVARACCQNR